jgi:hypothetical protein
MLSCGGLLTTALLITACGSSSSGSTASSSYAKESPSKIVSDVVTAMKSATSYQAAGTIDVDNVNAQVAYGIKLPSEVSFSLQQGAQLIKLVALPSATYIYGNTSYWKKQESSLNSTERTEVANRWFKAPASLATSATKALGDISPKQLATCLAQSSNQGRVTGTTTVNGTQAVELHFTGKKPGTSPENLYVSLAAPHYPLRLEETGKETPGDSGSCSDSAASSDNGHGELTLSHWNSAVIAAPAHSSPLP